MNTFVGIGLKKFQSRLGEISLIINEAKEKELINLDLYNVLCKSAQVLLVAHLEGFIKDFIKDIIDDLSYNLKFKDIPISIKRTYCEHFMEKNENGKFSEKAREKLIDLFEHLNPQLSADPFLFYNKNPSPDMLRKSLEKLSVKSFFELINNSDIDIVFSGTTTEVNDLLYKLRDELTNGIINFPYKLDISKFSIEEDQKQVNKNKTLWETFVDSILTDRHAIAHGDIISSSINHHDIEENLKKVHVLVYSIILMTCSRICPL